MFYNYRQFISLCFVFNFSSNSYLQKNGHLYYDLALSVRKKISLKYAFCVYISGSPCVYERTSKDDQVLTL